MKRLFIFFVVILLSYFSVKPLFASGLFPMHDDTQVGRVVAMGRALRTAQIPVRWVADLGYGYGYPIFNFYGPLPYYFGGSLYALGMSGLTATKIMMVAGIVLSGITMFTLASSLFGYYGGFVSSMLYIYAPYHAVQLYVRGAVGELWAYGFLPLVLYGLIQLFNKKTMRNGVAVGSLGLFGVITSHTILGYITVGLVCMGLILIAIRSYFSAADHKTPLVAYSLLCLFGLGMSSFFWLPAFFEMRFTSVAQTIGSTANYKDHFVCLSQFWYSPWGFGGSAPGCIDGMSYMVGKLHIITPIFFVLFWLRQKKHTPFISIMVIFTVLSVFFMLNVSLALWKLIPLTKYIQYPWRLLTFTIFGLSLLSGGIMRFVWFKRFPHISTIAYMLIVLLLYTKLFIPQTIIDQNPLLYESQEELRFRVSKVSDEYLPQSVPRPVRETEYVRDTIWSTPTLRVETILDTGTYARFNLTSTKPQNIVLNRAYFPGWRYFVDDKEVFPAIADGLPIVSIPDGISMVSLAFGNTPVRWFANGLTVLTAGIFIYWYGKNKKTIS